MGWENAQKKVVNNVANIFMEKNPVLPQYLRRLLFFFLKKKSLKLANEC